MSKKLIIFLSILAVLFMGGCAVTKSITGSYNNIVSLNEDVNKEWANVEDSYQRRSDLIPNLVASVQGEAGFEKSTLTDVIQARANATAIKLDPSELTPDKLEQFQKTQGQLGAALGRLMMVTEQYPALQANESFRALMTEISGTENRISISRKEFNSQVQVYNKEVLRFPTNLIAGYFGFKERAYFKMDEEAKKTPKVKFDFDSKKQ